MIALSRSFRLFLGASMGMAFLVAGAEENSLDFAKDIKPLLEQHCYGCHGETKAKGGVKLHAFGDVKSIYRDPKLWETVLAQLRDETMPPEEKPQPTTQERERLVEWLHRTLENPAPGAFPLDPGRPLLHRLSRLEYNNTVRDLLGVKSRPADRFPPDGGGGGGFDHNSATLFTPPILVEKYLEAAAALVEEAPPERIFIVRPNELLSHQDAARTIIQEFTKLAFRRPIHSEELGTFLRLFQRAEERGESFEAAVKLAIRAVLVSPHFLFRVEVPQSGEAHLVNDYELASRLSYFLWSSMPDAELFRLAGENRLRAPGVLDGQVQRMLLDAKARTFAENFVGQWFRTRELHTSAQPDPKRYPEYTSALREAMAREPIEFFHALLRENGSLIQLIDSDYTFANKALAVHYGLDGCFGEEFERVEFSGRERGGALGMAAVLTLTSYPKRTSPVLRGKWILEEILGTPPPPPPPMVKSLPEDDQPKDNLTFRQSLEKHRQNASCASCHKRMDPLGFGLENFDAIGQWRTKVNGEAVDASGEMVTGEKFSGPAELRRLLLERKDEFATNATERMLAYALNRGLEYYDIPLVKQMVKQLRESDYRIGTLVIEIVKSYPFQYRRGIDPRLSQN